MKLLLAEQKAMKPSVVLFRLQNFTTSQVNLSITNILTTFSNELAAGAVILVEPQRIRCRVLPLT